MKEHICRHSNFHDSIKLFLLLVLKYLREVKGNIATSEKIGVYFKQRTKFKVLIVYPFFHVAFLTHLD